MNVKAILSSRKDMFCFKRYIFRVSQDNCFILWSSVFQLDWFLVSRFSEVTWGNVTEKLYNQGRVLSLAPLFSLVFVRYKRI